MFHKANNKGGHIFLLFTLNSLTGVVVSNSGRFLAQAVTCPARRRPGCNNESGRIEPSHTMPMTRKAFAAGSTSIGQVCSRAALD
jgi:hypothetical protein